MSRFPRPISTTPLLFHLRRLPPSSSTSTDLLLLLTLIRYWERGWLLYTLSKTSLPLTEDQKSSHLMNRMPAFFLMTMRFVSPSPTFQRSISSSPGESVRSESFGSESWQVVPEQDLAPLNLLSNLHEDKVQVNIVSSQSHSSLQTLCYSSSILPFSRFSRSLLAPQEA